MKWTQKIWIDHRNNKEHYVYRCKDLAVEDSGSIWILYSIFRPLYYEYGTLEEAMAMGELYAASLEV